MRQSAEEPQNFTGQLLIAHPNMLDPNFRRTVLFISWHDPEDGALGVILTGRSTNMSGIWSATRRLPAVWPMSLFFSAARWEEIS